jgi:hypothetical protein
MEDTVSGQARWEEECMKRMRTGCYIRLGSKVKVTVRESVARRMG